MKKLSLKTAESILSRKEMKNIMAGSGSWNDTCMGMSCYMDLQCQQCYNSYNRPYCRNGSCAVH